MKIILASNNKKKIAELGEILEPLDCEIITQSEAGFNFSAEETGTTFEQNSEIKARALFGMCNEAVIADDSGLEVDALDKAPGVYSARYGGEGLSDRERYLKLLSALEKVPENKRTARFVAVITFISQSGKSHSFRGECEGKIAFEPAGENGFGYDPVFLYEGRSLALLSSEEKNKISHRAIALKKLSEFIKSEEFKC
ncbi:MAG: RdgB/HAM1 family non-canonical purine NTP pyrophosphatase [Oscillospiraceae bacterium]|jgi:XTP/dITP diphosphohydrolase